MKKVLTAIDKAANVFYEWAIMISGVAVTTFILAAAFMRYVLKKDFFGSEELILIAGYWLYFIGSMSAARSNTHINADMANLFVKDEFKLDIFHIFRDVLTLGICCIAMKWCADYWLWSAKLGPVTSIFKIPYLVQQTPMCLSFFVWFIYLVRDFISGLVHVKELAAARKEGAK